MSEAEAATGRIRTVCSYCGVGCGIVLDIARGDDGRRTVAKVSGDKQHPANAGRLCTKGATHADLAAAPGRLRTALIRGERGAEPTAVDVDAAVTETARRLRAVLDAHGPDALGLYVSGQMSLEAQYLANKLAKGFLRTHRIESNSRLYMASADSGYKLSLGADGPPGSYEDFERADAFFVIGANMADCHPVLFLRMMDRVKAAGAKLIVVDPRRNATADKADLFLQIRPGTDLALLNGLLHLLVEGGWTDPAFIDEHTEGWEDMPAFLRDYPPAKVAETTGIPEADIRLAARWIGEAGRWMSCWTMGLNQSVHGTWNTNALVNLHLATGAICRPGSGPFSLTGQPNAMGGREMGYMGPGLPGQRSVLVDEDRRFTEELWGLPDGTLRTDVGRGTVEMFEKMAAGEIRAPRPQNRPAPRRARSPTAAAPRGLRARLRGARRPVDGAGARRPGSRPAPGTGRREAPARAGQGLPVHGPAVRQPAPQPARRRQGGPAVRLRPRRGRPGLRGGRRPRHPAGQLPRSGDAVAGRHRPAGGRRGRRTRPRPHALRPGAAPAPGHHPRHSRPPSFRHRTHRRPHAPATDAARQQGRPRPMGVGAPAR